MTNQSPTIPPTAVSLWLADNCIHMDLPAIGGHTAHRLSFPNNAQGVARMMHLLSNRTHESKLGNDGDLTQAQLDKRLKMKVLAITGKLPPIKKPDTFSPTIRSGALEVMRRLGFR